MNAPITGTDCVPAKVCRKCGTAKELTDFHISGKASDGRASWCKACANSIARAARKRDYNKEDKRKWQLKTRYGLTPKQVRSMLESQGGVCVLCREVPKRPCVDHCHNTGAVRGILCHRCNVRLGGWDDIQWRQRAMTYLGLNDNNQQKAGAA